MLFSDEWTAEDISALGPLYVVTWSTCPFLSFLFFFSFVFSFLCYFIHEGKKNTTKKQLFFQVYDIPRKQHAGTKQRHNMHTDKTNLELEYSPQKTRHKGFAEIYTRKCVFFF